MHTKAHSHSSMFGVNWSPANAALAFLLTLLFLILLLLFLTLIAQPVQGQTYRVLYNFTGGLDGASSLVGVTMDAAGNLYGTTTVGGLAGTECDPQGCGTAFRLSPRGSQWTFALLHNFSGDDGANPESTLAIGPDGNLYGSTFQGGRDSFANGACGVIYSLTPPNPPPTDVVTGWSETVLHRFSGPDGSDPDPGGGLTFDPQGNLYGEAGYSGPYNSGNVFELVRSANGWAFNVLYNFANMDWPDGGVRFDRAGNLYGTTMYGGAGWGTVFQLTPTDNGWIENIVHNFNPELDGASPYGGVFVDSSGNLYGATPEFGAHGADGAVFELSLENGHWIFSTLHGFTGPDGAEPWGSVTMDQGGNLYGTTSMGGTDDLGTVFRLSPSNGGWTLTTLHAFDGTDGANPWSNVTIGPDGKLYGTTQSGGSYGKGVVWEITP